MEILNNRAIEFYRNDPKLLSKEELERQLNSCRQVLDDETFDYLKDLLNLNAAALDDPLEKFKNCNLTYFTVYKRILIYNVINSLKSLADNSDIALWTHKNKSVIKHSDSDKNIFEMDYNGSYHYFINIYNTLAADKELLDEEMDRYYRQIDVLKSSEYFDKSLVDYVRHKDYYETKRLSNDEEIVRSKIEAEILYCKRRILTLHQMAIRKLSAEEQYLIESISYYNYIIMETLGLALDDMHSHSDELSDASTPMISKTYSLDRPVVKVKTKAVYI